MDGIDQVVLNLSATEKTWLSITSEGKRLFSGFLEPSQTKTLTGLEAARMTVGNAGGIEVRLNGKPIGPIGKSGQVRVVVFTPDNFEVLPLALPCRPAKRCSRAPSPLLTGKPIFIPRSAFPVRRSPRFKTLK